MRARVRHHILRDRRLGGWKEKIEGRWHYRDLRGDRAWFEGWISFDAVTWNPADRRVYCGLNSLDGDLLYVFDPATESFEGLQTRAWADPYDAKIHRTLLRNPKDGCLYFGTSLLHDADEQRAAPGGKLVRYDPGRRNFEVLGIPHPHLYLQSIAADWERGILYAFTYPAEFLLRFDLGTGKARELAYLGNAILFAQPHNAVVDRSGQLWGTYAETRAWDETPSDRPIRLFKYAPDSDEFTWFDHGLPKRSDPARLLGDPPPPAGVAPLLGQTRHREDYGFCDSMAFDGERTIYAGTVAGVLARIDTGTGRVEKVANLIAAGRFPALAVAGGVLHGAGGMNGQTQLFRWDTRTDRIEDYGELADERTGEKPARIHELTVGDGERLYLGENDNHSRSSYLWSVSRD